MGEMRGSGSGCVHAPNCVGCPWIGRPYGEQLAAKRELVRDALAAYPRLDAVDVPDVVGSPRAFGYRNQAKLVVRATRGGRSERPGVALGIYRPGTHDVVDIRSCPLHAAPINDVLAGVAACIERLRLPIYDERTCEGWLRYVVVRASMWKRSAQVILVARSASLPPGLVRALSRIRGVSSVALNVNRDPGNAIFGRDFVALTKLDSIIEKIGALRVCSSAGAFLQANPNIAGRIYRQAAAWAALGPGSVAFDLYCGTGALAMHLAPAARTVFGIEVSPISIADAKRNARLNGIGNTRFFAGDVVEKLPELAAMISPDVVALNPPRKGADVTVREAVIGCRPARILYVSCNPVTMARDLDWLVERGCEVVAVRAYDMMPQTEHVECLALVRGPGG